jgi:hypothetical protein
MASMTRETQTADVTAIAMQLQNILDDVAGLKTSAEISRVGAILADTIETARTLYKLARESEQGKTCGKCGALLMGSEMRGTYCNECLDADARITVGESLARPHMVCDTCQRTWFGNELEAVGTLKHVDACGVCKATRLQPLCQRCRQAPAFPGSFYCEPCQAIIKNEDEAYRKDSAAPAVEAIGDGTYTVEFGDGTYRTLRIRTQEADATWMPGKRVASFLDGPDNWSNYQGFAFVNDDNTFKVWHKYEGATEIISALAVLLSGKEAMVNGLKAYGMASGKCGICGKKLTTPESIKLGIGPICADRLGI